MPEYRTNEKIRAEELRVIGAEGEIIGLMKTTEALKIAEEKGLDLIEVSPKANPPVAKMIDYGQFKYQREKELRKQKSTQKATETKGLRLSVRISDHDLNIRMEQAKKFMNKGNKLKLEIVLRGREKAHPEVAKKVMHKFVERIQEEYQIKIEQPIQFQGGRLTTILGKV